MLRQSEHVSDLADFSDVEAAAKILSLAEHTLSVGER
jgi:hypothetical protein